MADKLRPRRLEPDTLEYLRNVEETLKPSKEEEEDDDGENRRLMLWNIVDEISKRAASAASDRHACSIIETLVDQISTAQLRFLMFHFNGYYAHLWTNRYSSHVLQRIFSKLGPMIQREVRHELEEDEEEQDAERKAPLMTDLILHMCEELRPMLMECVDDISASHTLRSFLCVLGGQKIILEKRGKKAKHRAMAYRSNDDDVKTFDVPATFAQRLSEITSALVAVDDIQTFVCHIYSGPVYSILYRVIPTEAQSQLCHAVLDWTNAEASDRIFYRLGGDPVGSHFIEMLFETASPDFALELFTRYIKTHMLEYCEHPVSNYIIQECIRATKREDMFAMIVEEMQDALDYLFASGRPGVIWKLLEACLKFPRYQAPLGSALLRVIEQKESQKPEHARRSHVASLLALRLPSDNPTSNPESEKSKKLPVDVPRLWMDVAGANIVKILVQFPVFSSELQGQICQLRETSLVALSKDSTGSRCIIEPIWEMTNIGNDDDVGGHKLALYEKLKSSFTALSMDRMGCFSVLKAFKHLEVEQKQELVEMFTKHEMQLTGNHFGRLVLKECHASLYKTKPEQWKNQFTKHGKVLELFKDVMDNTTTEPEPVSKAAKKAAKKQKKAKKRKREEPAEEPEASPSIDFNFIHQALQNSRESTDILTSKRDKKKKKKKSKHGDEGEATVA